jgi:hypothetical protein
MHQCLFFVSSATACSLLVLLLLWCNFFYRFTDANCTIDENHVISSWQVHYVLTSYTIIHISSLMLSEPRLGFCFSQVPFQNLMKGQSIFYWRMVCFHVCACADSSFSSTSQHRAKLITWMPVVLALPVAELQYTAMWKAIQLALGASFVWYITLLLSWCKLEKRTMSYHLW